MRIDKVYIDVYAYECGYKSVGLYAMHIGVMYVYLCRWMFIFSSIKKISKQVREYFSTTFLSGDEKVTFNVRN